MSSIISDKGTESRKTGRIQKNVPMSFPPIRRSCIFLIFWIPIIVASASDVIVRIVPESPTAASSSSENDETIELLTNRAQFGSRDDISGVLVHAPLSDIFLCELYIRGLNQSLPEKPTQPTQNLIMLVPRGFCSFDEKARAAQDLYGVKGLLVYDRLGARYQWDPETEKVVFPQDKVDYECGFGKGVVNDLELDPPAYNGTKLDPLLDMRREDTNICRLSTDKDQSSCDSQLCLVASHEENSTEYPVCCAWDLPFAMPASKGSKAKDTKDIVAAFLTIRQAEKIARSKMLGSQITIESRTQNFNTSYLFLWILGTVVTVLASWHAAGEYRRFGSKLTAWEAKERARRNGKQRISSTPQQRNEGVLSGADTVSFPRGSANAATETVTRESAESAIKTNDVENARELSDSNVACVPFSGALNLAESSGQSPPFENPIQTKQNVSTLRSLPPPERRRRGILGASAVPLEGSQTGTSRSRESGTIPSFEMNHWHVLIFVVVASVLLILLFFFRFYNVIFVLYGIGCAGAIAYIIFNPLVVWGISKLGDHWIDTFNYPILCRYNGFDLLSQLIAYLWGALWIWFGLMHYKPQRNPFFWITTDIFGATFCVLTLSLLRLNSIKVATILMVAVFLYDIFFVFLTPYLTGGDSVMLAVASGGGNGDYCYKYPDDQSCKGVNFIPMLFILPKVSDPMNGSVILGLGDIILPGFLIAFCARHDEASRLVSANIPALRIQSPSKWYQGFFFIMSVAYSFGLFLAFVAVLLTGKGQPALLYICPIILATVFYLGRRDLKQLWSGAQIFALAERLISRSERLMKKDRSRREGVQRAEFTQQDNEEMNLSLSLPAQSVGVEQTHLIKAKPTGAMMPEETGGSPSIPRDISLPQPKPDDICFRNQSHPGTQDFVRVVKEAATKFSGEAFSPNVYKNIRAHLKQRQFFKLDRKEKKWQLATKFEIRDEIGVAYDECRGQKSPFFERGKRKQ